MYKVLCVLESSHQGNTKKIVDSLKKVCNLDIVSVDEVSAVKLRNYDLVGFASGIYFLKHDKKIINFVSSLCDKPADTFILSTAGSKNMKRNHKVLRNILIQRNKNILGEFSCLGIDKFGPFKLIGGINKTHPNEEDLRNAQEFMKEMINKKFFYLEPNK